MANITVCISDLHLGHENFLQDTFYFVTNRLRKELSAIVREHQIDNVFVCFVGDIVSGTNIYRNQYIESHLHKSEDIVTLGSYILHEFIKGVEDVVNIPVSNYIVTGTHL